MIIDAKQPIWNDTAHDSMDLLVTIDGEAWLPYTALPSDPVFVAAVGGKYGVIADVPAPVARSQATLISLLISAAKTASNSITAAIASTETHLAGYQSAANIVRAANGVPSNDPDKTAFASLAAALGLSMSNLATIVLAMDAAAVSNLAILVTLEAAAASATAVPQLATALTAYESAVTALVASLNGAGLTTTIAAPAPISIVGINA